VATAVILTPLLAACGSSKTSSNGATGTTAGTASAPSTAALAGAPIKIGWMDIEGSLGVDFTAQRKAAQDYLTSLNASGGIGGHRVELDSCITQATSGGATCANQFVQDKDNLVVNFSAIDTGSVYTILKAAHIPTLESGPQDAADLTPTGYNFAVAGGPLVQYATGNLFLANTLKVKTVGVVSGEESTAQQAANLFVKDPLKALGIKTTIANLDETNPDYTTAVNTLFNSDVLMFLLSCQSQDAGVKQAVHLGYKGKILGCAAPQDLTAMGSAATNLISADQVLPATDPANASNAGVKAFLAFTQKYDLDSGFYNEDVYVLLQTVQYAFGKAGGPSATGPQLAAVLGASSHWPIPLLSPAGFSCSTASDKAAPTACNTDTIFVQVSPGLKTVHALTGFLAPPAA
jgi:Periplasmic binding protein